MHHSPDSTEGDLVSGGFGLLSLWSSGSRKTPDLLPGAKVVAPALASKPAGPPHPSTKRKQNLTHMASLALREERPANGSAAKPTNAEISVWMRAENSSRLTAHPEGRGSGEFPENDLSLNLSLNLSAPCRASNAPQQAPTNPPNTRS
ncbi:unnamed protein product [Lota lota]